MDETHQAEFRDGTLVTEKEGFDFGDATLVEPGEGTGYSVEVKADALDANRPLRSVVDEHGYTLAFESRSLAERYATRLANDGGDLRVQAAAPNDPSGVDAYLLAGHDPAINEPASIDGDAMTFDVGANLYGALGEAVLTATPKSHALTYFVREDLDVPAASLQRELKVDVETDVVALGPDAGGNRRTWHPDCTVLARDGWNGPVLERYYCEIKTGDASLERAQRETMRALASERRVLEIRVRIRDLPEQYSLRIREVEGEPKA